MLSLEDYVDLLWTSAAELPGRLTLAGFLVTLAYHMTRISQSFQFKKSQDYVRVLVMEDMIHRNTTPESMVHGANMGPTWVLSVPDGPHVGPMNVAIRDCTGEQ